MNLKKLLSFNNKEATDILEDFNVKTKQIVSEYVSNRDELLYGKLWDETYNNNNCFYFESSPNDQLFLDF